MEEIMINGGYVVAIVLVLIGIIKIPFSKLKDKMGGWYTATLTLFSLAISFVSCILAQLYLLNAALWTWDFVSLCLTVYAGVFVSYNGVYEGFKLKKGVHTLWDKILIAIKGNPESKLSKIINKIGVDKVQAVVNNIAAAEVEVKEENLVVVETENSQKTEA